MKLIVGLGNPGADYSRHRHNLGFMAADAIAARQRLGPWRRKFRGEVAEGDIGAEKVVLLKPQTFMNESGRSVAEAARFYKLPLSDVIVLHDELDLAAGKVRVKLGGGVAGHNGLRSLDAYLGGRDFWRVRIGIGHPGDKERVLGHVLGDFHKAEQPWVEELTAAIGDAIGLLVAGDDGRFMNKVALVAAPKPKRGDAAA
jgi:PTH1 family peptidyl-tRNA hydrolase